MLRSFAKLFSLTLLINYLVARKIVTVSEPPSIWKKDDNVIRFKSTHIKGFRISHFSDTYEAKTDYTGILFYDMGKCTREVVTACRQMKDGYVIIYKDEELIKLKNERKLRSLGEAALDKFFVNKSIKFMFRLVTEYDVKMAIFNLKDGVLNTQLSTDIMNQAFVAVDNSLDMNAFEYALLETIRYLWTKKGKGQTHWVSNVQRTMRARADRILEPVAGLPYAERFRLEYTYLRVGPLLTKPKQVLEKQTAPTLHQGRLNHLPENELSRADDEDKESDEGIYDEGQEPDNTYDKDDVYAEHEEKNDAEYGEN